ncbi:MAG: family 43 glycosylhydrolase [Pirellulaceae bacterium]
MSNLRYLAAALLLLAHQAVCAGEPPLDQPEGSPVRTPRLNGEYTHIYKPAGDTFPGPSTDGLEAGRYYDEWMANDHTFVRNSSGRWHALGITHPWRPSTDVHGGAYLAFHAVAPQGPLKQVLKRHAWKDQPKVLPPADRPGEGYELYAPYIIREGEHFYMFYSPQPVRWAVSTNLYDWEPKGPIPGAPVGRDPNVFLHDGVYYLTVCGRYQVEVATSQDLKTWETHPAILTMDRVDPESPSLVRYNNTFYLFVCGWDGKWDRKSLAGAYQHVTYVYQSDDPLHFSPDRLVTRLDAHAPEVFQDEAGDWYISSAEWPNRGVSIARLVWE